MLFTKFNQDMRLTHKISDETTTTRDYAAPELRAYDELWGGGTNPEEIPNEQYLHEQYQIAV